MNIESKGPTALVFDVSTLIGTLDEDGVFSLLAWQYVIERDLVQWAGLTLQSTVPRCKSLERQYEQIRALQDCYGMTIVDLLDWDMLVQMRQYVIAIEVTKDVLVMVRRKRLSLE
jgi:hypothetical protein